MHFVGPDQLHGFEERRTTDIYPADFGWTPNWLQPDERIDWWFHNMDAVTQAGIAEVTNQLLFDDEVGHQGVRALHDLARDHDERPWMLVVSFTHPHDPYVTRSKYWDLYDGGDIPLPEIGAGDVAARPAHRAAAPRQRDGRGRDHRAATYAGPAAPTTATSPTSTSGPRG